MKKMYRIIFIALLLQYVCSPIFANETRVTQLFITNNGQEYRHTFLYDDVGNVRLETKYAWSGNTWLRHSQIEWTRSTNVVTQHERVFENNAWRDTYSIETQYNAQGLKIQESFFRYASGARIPIKVVLYDYWSNMSIAVEYRNEIQVLVSQFEQNNNILTQWIVGTDTAFFSHTVYDSQGRPQAMLVRREVEGTFQNADSITWFYNDSGQLISQRSKIWNEQGSFWQNSQMTNFEYDSAGNLIAENHLLWSGLHWQNFHRREFQFQNNLKTGNIVQGFIHGDWRNMVSIHYGDFRDGFARKMRSEFDFWGGNAGELAASYIPFYFNGELVTRRAERIVVSFDDPTTDIPKLNLPYLIINIYPNPSDGRFYLSSTQHEILSWRVFSFTGQLIKSHTEQTHSSVVDLTNLPQGVYILQVQTTIGIQQKRLIKR